MKGAEYVGDFNIDEREDVSTVKDVAALLIDTIIAYGKDPRRNAIAITHVEQAAMMAVKSIFSEATK